MTEEEQRIFTKQKDDQGRREKSELLLHENQREDRCYAMQVLYQNDAGHATSTHYVPKRNPNGYICLPFTFELRVAK